MQEEDGMKRRMRASAISVLAGLILFSVLAFSLIGCDEEPPPPLPECEDTLDCPDEHVCTGGKCIKKVTKPKYECVQDDDCPGNKICQDNKCKYECEADSDCASNETCEGYRCTKKPECNVVTVNFDFNEYYLTSEAQRSLRANAECLKQKNPAQIVIEGHCDERGSIQYNLSLGQKRAQAVRDFLVDMGIEKSKVKVISYGEERPVDYGHDEDAWAKNRRGETVLK